MRYLLFLAVLVGCNDTDANLDFSVDATPVECPDPVEVVIEVPVPVEVEVCHGGDLGFDEACDVVDDQCDKSQDLFCYPFLRGEAPKCTKLCERESDCGDCGGHCNQKGLCS